jgi:RHS repeat-associated protein
MGNLMKVELPDGDEIEYLIDAQNRRVGKKLNGQIVARWIYSGRLAPVAQLDSAGNIAARYVYAAHVNIPDYIVTDLATYRVITDHLGSLRLVVNEATGEVVQRMDYDAWGNVLADNNPGFTPFGYAGGMYENQTRLVRFGARDYTSEEGRWMAKDPIKFFGDMNFYCYVKNQPLVGKDPTGLWSPEAHDEIVRHALEGTASSAQIRTLQILGRHFDETTQSPEESFKHSMRNPFQARDEAKRDRDAFITRNLSTARQLCDMGFENLALEFLTRALHPIMDSFSPMHREANGNPKVWHGLSLMALPKAIGHSPIDFIGRETSRDISQLQFLALDATLQQAYSYVFRR